MAFPSIGSSNTSVESSDVTTHNIAYPASIADGDLLVAQITTDANETITWPEGWFTCFSQSNGTECTVSVAYRYADGSESGTIDVTTGTVENSAHWCVRIPAGEFDIGCPVVWATATGTSATPDPPSLTPGFGAQDYLWICGYGADDDDNFGAGFEPTSYTAGSEVESAQTTTSCMCGYAYRQVNGSSEDPGTFDMAASEGWVSFTLAIVPSGVSGRDVYAIDHRASAFSTGNKSVTVGWPADSMIVAQTSHAAGSGPISHAVTGGTGLSWTQGSQGSAASGAAESSYWYAWASSAQTGQTVTNTLTGGGGGYIEVFVLQGTESSGIGDDAQNTGTDATAETTGTGANGVVATADGSLVLGGGVVWTGPVNVTAGTAQTKTNEADDATNASTVWSQWLNAGTTNGSQHQLNASWSGNSDWAFAAVEVKPAASTPTGTGAFSTTATVTGAGTPKVTGSSAFNSSVVLAASGKPIIIATGAFSSTASMTGSGSVGSGVTGTGAFSTTATASGTGSPKVSGTSALVTSIFFNASGTSGGAAPPSLASWRDGFLNHCRRWPHQ